jgi:hypothetical protein
MAENSKEQMDDAIARAKKEVAEEVKNHQAEDIDLEEVTGGASDSLEEVWEVGVSAIYKT